MRLFARLLPAFLALSGAAFAAEKKAIVIGADGRTRQIQAGEYLGAGSLQSPIDHSFWNEWVVVDTSAGLALKQVRSANIAKFGMRVQIGAAVLNTGNFGCPTCTNRGYDSGSNTDWLSRMAQASWNGGEGLYGPQTNNATLAVLADDAAGSTAGSATESGQSAILAAIHSLNAGSGGSPRAFEAYGIGDNTHGAPIWSAYLECNLISSTANRCFGLEIETRHSTTRSELWNPTTAFDNSTVPLAIGCGAGIKPPDRSSVGVNNCSAAAYVEANPAQFDAGLIFRVGSIATNANGTPAIMLDKVQEIQWWNAATLGFRLYGDSYANFNMVSGSGAGSVIVQGGILTTRAIVGPGGSTALIGTTASITSGAGASTGTLTNAPVAGNPTKWAKIDDNGVSRYVPLW